MKCEPDAGEGSPRPEKEIKQKFWEGKARMIS